ncbi:MAG: DUF3341 domain-containing protein [Cytophagales bacterium]|nr:DUF3341 domain-containing protein [Cytophagales bacterium]
MESGKNFLVGVYEDEEVLLKAVKQVQEGGVNIYEVFTPFPVHHLDHALGYRRSRLPVAAFLFGLLGAGLALLMQYYMLGIDWPMNIGGKNFVPLPTFIPVTFELTVLLAALGMVSVFLVISDLKPYGKPKIFDRRSTDDKLVVAVDLAENALMEKDIKTILLNSGAVEVNKKQFD